MREEALSVPMDRAAVVTSCQETQIGKTVYRVISVSNQEFDWKGTLEKLAVRRAVAETGPFSSKIRQTEGMAPSQGVAPSQGMTPSQGMMP